MALGFELTAGVGKRIAPERVIAFQQFPRPVVGALEEDDVTQPGSRNIGKMVLVRKVRQVLGSFGFYRGMLDRFAHLTKSLRTALVAGAKITWTDEAEADFVALRNVVSADPLI